MWNLPRLCLVENSNGGSRCTRALPARVDTAVDHTEEEPDKEDCTGRLLSWAVEGTCTPRPHMGEAPRFFAGNSAPEESDRICTAVVARHRSVAQVDHR